MRSVILPLLIFMLTAGIAIAENQDKEQKPSEGFKNERVSKMRGGKFSRMFVSVIHKANSLSLNKDEKHKVNELGKEYAVKIIRSENEARYAQRDFLKQLQAGEFDPSQLKTLNKDAEAANLAAANTFVDGLAALKDTVGPDKFAKLIPLTKVNRNALVKLKQGKPAPDVKTKDSAADTTEKKSE